MRFVDTNILLYAVSNVRNEQAKARRAREVLGRRDLALSAQVLGEFYVQSTRTNGPAAMSHELASNFIDVLLRYPIQPITVALVRSALATRERFQISYWDAAILEAARSLGCGVVLSEDLSDGQDYDGVRVENPFA